MGPGSNSRLCGFSSISLSTNSQRVLAIGRGMEEPGISDFRVCIGLFMNEPLHSGAVMVYNNNWFVLFDRVNLDSIYLRSLPNRNET
jgi:hypothetical protein